MAANAVSSGSATGNRITRPATLAPSPQSYPRGESKGPGFHTGFVGSGFNANNGPLMRVAMSIGHIFARSPEKGAETLVWLADSPEVSQTNGAYFMDKREIRPSPAARDADAARRLWQLSEDQVGATVALHDARE
jgi:hypothetical protein